ncbi:MAG: asparaginase [Acidobacteria bacterium]|nr:asparaginase [Acidobacteriota bacterium]MBK8813623.1 asparaginase [Acidobacteriota bacterium]
MKSEILATVIRGETVESIHRGHLLIVDGEGLEVLSAGDPETLAFIRSSGKPFQLMPFLLAGGAEKFGYSERAVALACASHSGEPMHTELAAEMLAKAGFEDSDLRCGVHLPFNERRADEMVRAGERPTQLHNNCSGKHSAMLAYAKLLGADPAAYEDFDHPIQIEMLKLIARFTDTPVSEIPVAVDGCAAPNFALSVRAMATAARKLVSPPDDFDDALRAVCERIRGAMMNFPELVGGTGRLDTMLMQAAPGQFISKIGAEGVWLAGVVPSEKWPTGLGIAMKIEDGDDKRARAVISVAVLRSLGVFGSETLSELSPLPIINRRGDVVGRVESAL